MSIKVLFLSRNYPNVAIPQLGPWVEGLAVELNRRCEVRVVSPVPYSPPIPGIAAYAEYRRIPSKEIRHGIEVRYPRFLTGPGYSLYNAEASTYYWGVRRCAEELRREFAFDLVHAHFIYPDGVVASRLARRYRVPFLVSDYSDWKPWMDRYPRVRRRAVQVSRDSAFHMAVSRHTLGTVEHFTGPSDRLRVMPTGFDSSVFAPLPEGQRPDPNRLIYVGRLHRVKGVDILLRAFKALLERRPDLRLLMVGGGWIYRNYVVEEERLKALARELDLGGAASFAEHVPHGELVDLLRGSAMLVLPSRREAIGTVLTEALACGVPVVATRVGGPEDVVTPEVGVLVPPEDPDALAAAIEDVLDHRARYDPARLRQYALEHFSWERIADRTQELYEQALAAAR